jgi:predicted esterase
MHSKLNILVAGLLLGLASGCTTVGDDDATDTPSGADSPTEAGDGSDAEDTTASDAGSEDDGGEDGEDATEDGEATDESTSSTEPDDTTESPPETCLTGKVGVFNVNTEVLYRDDPDFVVHTYPSNSPDDSPAATEDFFAKVEADPSVDKNFLFASGFSYGATMSLIHGYMSSDKLAGIIHISQYSNPTHFHDEFYSATRRIPVYIIHDDSYDQGGQALRHFLLEAGYQDGVDLFYLDFVGGHDAPPPEEWQTVLEWMKTMSLNGPCEGGG